MRITAEEKSATRERILAAAVEAFRKRGFEATTTRDIATAAGIATGTLFNYFATKEAILETLAEKALGKARSGFAWDAKDGELEEGLFAFIAAELRQLRPFRKFIGPLLESSLCPLAVAERSNSNDVLRVEHLEAVAELARRYGFADLSPIALQVYWTLYIGVLSFWAVDKSPKQEDTLALVHQSLAMFADWLRSEQRENSK